MRLFNSAATAAVLLFGLATGIGADHAAAHVTANPNEAPADSWFRTALRVSHGCEGTPMEAQELTFIAANPSAGVEPIRRASEAVGAGSWRVEQLLLVPPGSWSVRIDALISDFEKASLDAVIKLQ